MKRRDLLPLIGAAPAMAAQQIAGEPPGRIPPPAEIINTLEMQAIAARKLDSAAFASLADSGNDRAAFNRITFRPRLMVNTIDLNLALDLFGQRHFAPILIGPAESQQRFHPEGELALVRGAGKAKTTVILSERSSVPLAKVSPEAPGFWYQIFPGTPRTRIDEAVALGCKAVCLTLGSGEPSGWAAIDALRKGLTTPFLLKGVMSAAEARLAAERGVAGIIVSGYRGARLSGIASTIEVLPAIAEAAMGRTAILIDGGFRRGSDILKALALGARAAIVTRPALWGLAAYGAPGVQQVIELLQSELARDMAMCGKPNLAAIDKTAVRIHRR